MAAGIVTHGSWIISNSKQIRMRMAKMTSQNLGSTTHQTYDFSTMYPSMDLSYVKQKVKDYVALVFENAKQTEYPPTSQKC